VLFTPYSIRGYSGANSIRYLTALSLALFLTLDHYSFGQTVQTNQAELARTVTTVLVDDHIVPSPNDSDLGEQQVLKRAEGYQPFNASVAVPFYWTSNVALTNRGVESDFLVSPIAAIAYQPRITTNLYGFVGVREQLFYYDRFSNLNFGSFDVQVALAYTVPQLHDLLLFAGYDYNRLTKRNSFDNLFSNHALRFAAVVPFRLSNSQQLSVGADADISFTGEPDPPRRHEFGAYVVYSAQLARAFSVDATARLALRDYVLSDRIDVSEILALGATYSFTRFVSASAIASFAGNQSNHSVFDYHVGNVGGSVGISIRF
jgi:hypothetical protein